MNDSKDALEIMFDETDKLIQRLLGCLEGGSTILSPLPPKQGNNITAHPADQMYVEMHITDDGRAIRWQIMFNGILFKTGLWQISVKSWQELQAEIGALRNKATGSQ